MSPNPHDIIHFSYFVKENLFAKIEPLYRQGLSLREIASQTGIAKTTIRKELIHGGVPLRTLTDGKKGSLWRKSGKVCMKPPYGFCYFEGQLTKHPKEYTVLKMIYERWKSGQNANSIADTLNGKKIPSPMNKRWSWNSVINIIDRFKKGTVALKEGTFELK